jgi:hypothetical protein
MSTLRVVSVETQNLKNSNGTSAINIDSSGRIKHENSIAFNVSVASPGATVAAGNVVLWNSVNFNNGSGYSTGNGRFTAPKAGYYHFESTAGGTDSFYFDMRQNGSIWRRAERGSSNGGFVWMTVATVLYLNVNDYVDIRIAVGTVRVDAPYAGFSGHLIG